MLLSRRQQHQLRAKKACFKDIRTKEIITTGELQNIQNYCNQLKCQLYLHCTEHAEMTGAACIEDKVILSHLCYQSSTDWRNEAVHGEELVA